MPTIKILGSHGNRSDSFHTTCIQVAKHTVIDAGNIIYGLKENANQIDNIFISHSHIDHILDSAFLCDNYFSHRKESLKIYGLKVTIEALKKHIFNWTIWPDFSSLKLVKSSNMALEFIEIEYNQKIDIDGVLLTPIKSNHTVDCCGYLIEKDGSGILFSADTYKNDEIWRVLNNSLHVKSLIIDVSFPSNLSKIAKDSKHLTPSLLKEELSKLNRDDVTIYVNHIKSNYHKQIEKEIEDIGLNKENILTGYEIIDYGIPKIYKEKKSIPHIKKIEMLNKIGIALSANANLTNLLDMIVTEAKNLTHADGGTLYILNPKSKELDFTVIQTDSLNIHMGGEKGSIDWPSLPLYIEDKIPNKKMVAAICALEDRVINIPDVYNVENFNFEGTKKFDANTGYRSCSMLVIPLKNHENEIIGVLQLINKIENNKIVPFDNDDENITHSLASQAAISITNTNLVEDLENLLEGFLKSIIYAVRRKSPYTANHIHKMVSLSKMIAKAVDEDTGFYKEKHYSKDDFKLINFAALMHDVGKLATPDYILDKSTKLDGLNDAIEIIKTRAWAIKSELEIVFLKNKITEKDYKKQVQILDENLNLLIESNKGSEFMPIETVNKIKNISSVPFICNEKEFYLITPREANLLMVQKGTLTEEERNKINEHAVISLEILNRLPFPKKYEKIPSVSGEHHEKINGKGYPQGLKGDEISFESRILAIADIFEALTASDRPYKKANKLSVAMKILYFMAKDNELDKDLVKFFYESGLYLEFANKTLDKEQIDDVDIDFSSL